MFFFFSFFFLVKLEKMLFKAEGCEIFFPCADHLGSIWRNYGSLFSCSWTWQIINCFLTASYSVSILVGVMLHGLGGGASPTIVLISHKSYLPNSCTRLTMRRVMDTAKLVMKSGNLNEFSMVLLNNILSLPLGVLLIFVFKEVDYLFET
ncbi:hypothetical protein HHK36_009220 [Tetracentron sinense]|uniref:Uncharacterized protein n=1 Tax=Tetracentron sinense TaxID=13715 RepID=A0A834ZCM1_TETSI|nr:hypothetical protein HHK36_009220 [Tetracentron sinense]